MVAQAFGGLGIWAMPRSCGGFCIEDEENVASLVEENVASLVADEHC